jgi:hypothetical protein
MRQDGKLIAMITGASPHWVYFYPHLQGQTILEQAFTSVLPTKAAPTFRRFHMVYQMK